MADKHWKIGESELWCQEDGIGEVQERMCGRETVRQWGMQLGGSISCTEPAWEIAIELSAAHPPPSHLINCTPPTQPSVHAAHNAQRTLAQCTHESFGKSPLSSLLPIEMHPQYE